MLKVTETEETISFVIVIFIIGGISIRGASPPSSMPTPMGVAALSNAVARANEMGALAESEKAPK